MKKLLSLSFLCLLLFSACDKDKDPTKNAKLPAATQEGRNTVGFTFDDGQVWVPYYECALLDNPCGKASVNVSHPADAQKRIGLSFARWPESNKSSFSIRNINSTNSITSTGEKIDSLRITYTRYGSSQAAWGYADLTEYMYQQPGSSFMITKLDRQNEVISGTFHLILKESGGSRTITLSNGRFDYKFGTCECD